MLDMPDAPGAGDLGGFAGTAGPGQGDGLVADRLPGGEGLAQRRDPRLVAEEALGHDVEMVADLAFLDVDVGDRRVDFGAVAGQDDIPQVPLHDADGGPGFEDGVADRQRMAVDAGGQVGQRIDLDQGADAEDDGQGGHHEKADRDQPDGRIFWAKHVSRPFPCRSAAVIGFNHDYNNLRQIETIVR